MVLFQCGLPSLEECRALAESAVSEGDIFNAVKYYLMSPEPEAALGTLVIGTLSQIP